MLSILKQSYKNVFIPNNMKYIRKLFLIGLSFSAFFIHSGCKKTDTLERLQPLSGTKVYDDTLASFSNSSGRIASATDRIYMTYGLGTEDPYSTTYATNPAITKLNALDNKGNLLWQKTLPTDISIKAILALDDGGCLLAGINLLEFPTLNLFFYSYDRNGKEILTDSVPFPNTGSDNFVTGFGLMRLANGNILVYGNYLENWSFSKSFASEYNLNLNLQWNQVYQFNTDSYITGCTIDPDGGYLFAGYNTETIGSIQFGKIFLIKTNASGDTLWTKHFATQERLYSNGFVALANGNYGLSYTYSINSGNMDIGIQETYLMELNEEGDSLNSARLDIDRQIYNSALLPLANGGVYALMNSGSSGGIWKQNNTSSVILNASLTSSEGGFFQSQTNENFGTACLTSDGRIACSGLIQPYGKSYYKPALLLINKH